MIKPTSLQSLQFNCPLLYAALDFLARCLLSLLQHLLRLGAYLQWLLLEASKSMRRHDNLESYRGLLWPEHNEAAVEQRVELVERQRMVLGARHLQKDEVTSLKGGWHHGR